MSDPVAFGTARLDEDEKRAEAMRHFTVDEDEFYSCPAARTEPLGDLEWGEENCHCGLAARKARALREVAAKRAILAEHAPLSDACQRCSQDEEQPLPVGWWIMYPCPTVRHLLAVWSDHPDYDQERKP